MRKTCFALLSLAVLPSVAAFEIDKSAMSQEYWDIWNDDVLAKMDADIEKYRKADAEFEIDAPGGAGIRLQPKMRWGVKTIYPKSVAPIVSSSFKTSDLATFASGAFSKSLKVTAPRSRKKDSKDVRKK